MGEKIDFVVDSMVPEQSVERWPRIAWPANGKTLSVIQQLLAVSAARGCDGSTNRIPLLAENETRHFDDPMEELTQPKSA